MPTNVLVIDDSKLITKLVTKALLTNNINNHFFAEENIYIAHDGMQAFEILGKNNHITLVISDVMMPILSGEELIEILIDIDKINSLDLFFITTENIASTMSSTSKAYSKGIIHKPFNNVTFCEQINSLQLLHTQKSKKQKQIKLVHERQMRHLRAWIDKYCEQKELLILACTLNTVIESEFKHYNPIDKDELFMMFGYIIENYFFEMKQNECVDISLLHEIHNAWHKPSEYGKLALQESLMSIFAHANETLKETSTQEEVIYAITQPLNTALLQLLDGMQRNAKLCFNDYFPYFSDLLDIFSTIDANFEKKRSIVLLNHIEEIQNIHKSLHISLNESNIQAIFPMLGGNKKIITMLENDFENCLTLIKEKIVPLYMFETNKIIWKNAKKSPNIVHFLKENLKNKMPNTHNLLHYFEKITKEEMRKFVKYERIKVAIISADRELLHLFKSSLAKHLPLWEISVYTAPSLLHANIDKTKYDKLIIDLNFKDTIFNNGLQFFNYLNKKKPIVQNILDNDGVYFLASAKQVEILHNKKETTNYNIVLKPLNEKNIYQKIFWES